MPSIDAFELLCFTEGAIGLGECFNFLTLEIFYKSIPHVFKVLYNNNHIISAYNKKGQPITLGWVKQW